MKHDIRCVLYRGFSVIAMDACRLVVPGICGTSNSIIV